MTTLPSPAGSSRLLFLDVIRVVAVLSIVLFHFHPAAFVAGAAPGTVPALMLLRQPLGDLGVTLFIIISATALMTSTSTGSAGRFSTADFYVKRFLAIFPSYWIAYAVVAVLLFAGRGDWTAGIAPWKLAFTVTGLDGFLFQGRSSHYLVGEWFVGFILCLYAIFPILRQGVTVRPWVTACAIGVVFVGLHRHYDQLFTLMENRNPLLRLPEFFFGLCFLHHVRPHLGRWAAASAAFVLVVMVWVPPIPDQVYGIALGVACFCLLAFSAERVRIRPRIADVLRRTSKYAFLAFLVHHQIIQAVRSRVVMPLGPAKTAALFLFVVAASFVAAMLLMPLVERFTEFLRRWLRPGASRRRAILAGETVLLVLLVGGLAFDLAVRSPSMDRKLAALSSRMVPTTPGLDGMALIPHPPRYAEAVGRWVLEAGIGVYGTHWWPQVGVVRYDASARDDRRCSGSVDMLVATGPQRGARGWVTTSPPSADVLIVLTDQSDETVGYGISGQARPDVTRAVPGARHDSGWIAIAEAPPARAYAYVEGRFCRL
ncbi:acyltransferase family protein [Variovorax sp. PvP013]|jgi:peptidoglycan/LPS O-acetylase OafA/YrhL|uniref:acyltransferase family protein n=1 Tax=Variovorax sp. PvP013 TaxID=3156435 RepID=UPI003D1AAA3D